MSRRDYIIKWTVYAVALFPAWWAECYVFSAFPIFGIRPMLLPLAAVAVAALEGAFAGAGFGLAVGIFADALYAGAPGAMTLGLTALCIGAGLMCRYVMRGNFAGYFLCAFIAMGVIDLLRVLSRLLAGTAGLGALLAVAVPEILISLAFTPILYLIFRWVHRRTGTASLL